MNNRSRNNPAKGFSLIELTVVSLMTVGMCLALAAVLRMGQRSWQAGQNHMTVSFELRRGINAMSRELAQTQAGLLQVPGAGALPANGNFYNSVQFQVPQDVDGNGNVLDGAGALEWSPNAITYSLGGVDGRQVQRSQGGAVSVLAHGVTALQFRRLTTNPSIVEMRMTVQRGSSMGGFINQADLTTRIRVRN